MAEIFNFMDKISADDNMDKPYAYEYYNEFAAASLKLANQLCYIPGAREAVQEYSKALGILIAKTTAPGIKGNPNYCWKHMENNNENSKTT